VSEQKFGSETSVEGGHFTSLPAWRVRRAGCAYLAGVTPRSWDLSMDHAVRCCRCLLFTIHCAEDQGENLVREGEVRDRDGPKGRRHRRARDMG